jgi:hypothetical protein
MSEVDVTRTQESAPDDTAVFAAVPAGDPAGESAEVDQGPDDGLAVELAKAAPRRWWNRGTLVLGALALLVGGFLGGVQVEKNYGTTDAASNRPAGFTGRGAGGAGGYPGGAGYPGFAGGGQRAGATATASAAPAAGGTTGTVKLVDGAAIYLQTADGTLVTVKTTSKTTVRTAAGAKGVVKDVKAGDTVTVQGAAAADGTVTATAVTEAKK